ncbi:MAG: hypothetical protein ABI950_02055 [Solirubrobacteraceae bacterium]
MEPATPPDGLEARVVDLRPRHAMRRLAETQEELDALRASLVTLVAERDAAQASVREAQADALTAREELAARIVAESEALAGVAAMRGQVEELRIRAESRDERDQTLARLAGELAQAARAAREDVDRHAEARATAEQALTAERARVEEARASLAAERDRAGKAESALRAELDALQGARERAVSAEEAAREARAAELAALDSARDRLTLSPPTPAVPIAGHDSLIAELGRAADRLRQEAAGAVEAAATAPRPSALRRLARRLRGH